MGVPSTVSTSSSVEPSSVEPAILTDLPTYALSGFLSPQNHGGPADSSHVLSPDVTVNVARPWSSVPCWTVPSTVTATSGAFGSLAALAAWFALPGFAGLSGFGDFSGFVTGGCDGDADGSAPTTGIAAARPMVRPMARTPRRREDAFMIGVWTRDLAKAISLRRPTGVDPHHRDWRWHYLAVATTPGAAGGRRRSPRYAR